MLYGPDAAKRNGEMYEALQKAPESAEDQRVKDAASELLKDIDLSSINLDDELKDAQVASSE